MLVGRVISKPEESQRCLRFLAEFAPHETTEVTIGGSRRERARGITPGEKIVISKYASIGYLKIAAKDFIRTWGLETQATG